MNNALYKDTPTAHRYVADGRRRIVYARHDHEGNFVRFVVHKTKNEVEAARRKYLPARVGIASWFEVYEHNFAG